MIANTTATDFTAGVLTRVGLVLRWADDAKIADRLQGFSATEAGSALDMLKAAEIVEEPHLRRLFFRHAVDEARHAELFHATARRLAPPARDGSGEYRRIAATRQNLLARWGLVRFVAFVFLAESQAARQFEVIRAHFRDRPDLRGLFDRVLDDERFHVAYSKNLLERWARRGQAWAVRRALVRVRLDRAWQAWRRAGRILGDAVVRVLTALVYFVVLPVFVVAERKGTHRAHSGWFIGPAPATTIAAARRQG